MSSSGSPLLHDHDAQAMLDKLDNELDHLIDQIMSARETVKDANFVELTDQLEPLGKRKFKRRQKLRGHLSKITDFAWMPSTEPDKVHQLISASQDGKLIVWSCRNAHKLHMFNLITAWVTACAITPAKAPLTLSRRSGNNNATKASRSTASASSSSCSAYVCSGGLDNLVSLYALPQLGQLGQLSNANHHYQQQSNHSACVDDNSDGDDDDRSLAADPPLAEFAGHQGYISKCKFFCGPDKILSGSGDCQCRLWDTSTGQCVRAYLGHSKDVTAIDFAYEPDSQGEVSTFITSSLDCSCRLWDIRTGSCVQILQAPRGVESEITDVCLFPKRAEYGFVCSTEQGSCHLWDLRADQPIADYFDPTVQSPCTTLCLSKSGRLLFTGHDDAYCHAWDVLREERVSILSSHSSRISGVGISQDGQALCSVSWDSSGAIYTAKTGKR